MPELGVIIRQQARHVGGGLPGVTELSFLLIMRWSEHSRDSPDRNAAYLA